MRSDVIWITKSLVAAVALTACHPVERADLPLPQAPGKVSTFRAMAAGDFTGDGLDDLLVTWTQHPAEAIVHPHFETYVTLFEGGATEALEREHTVPLRVEFFSQALLPGDFDSDGDLDAIALWVSVVGLENDGRGSFRERQVSAQHVAPHMLAGDATGDGKLDLIACVAWPAMTLSAGTTPWTFAMREGIPAGMDDCALVDLAGDGAMEVIGVRDDVLEVLAVDDAGWAGEVTLRPLGFTPESVLPGDVDRDGLVDLVFVVRTSETVRGLEVRRVSTEGAFSEPIHALQGISFRPTAQVLTDLDGDGVLDFAAADASHVLTALGRGDGTFADAQVETVPGGEGLVAADVDGDRRTELFRACGERICIHHD